MINVTVGSGLVAHLTIESTVPGNIARSVRYLVRDKYFRLMCEYFCPCSCSRFNSPSLRLSLLQSQFHGANFNNLPVNHLLYLHMLGST